MSLIIEAAQFAEYHHRGVSRKWGSEVHYITHPARVAGRIAYHPLACETLVAAAWLHDVLEDCPEVSSYDLFTLFGQHVASMVVELTNRSKSMPNATREERKAADRAHIAGASCSAKMIKLADRADNLADMREAPTSFLRVYVPESVLLLDVLAGTDADLEREYVSALSRLQGLLARCADAGNTTINQEH